MVFGDSNRNQNQCHKNTTQHRLSNKNGKAHLQCSRPGKIKQCSKTTKVETYVDMNPEIHVSGHKTKLRTKL